MTTLLLVGLAVFFGLPMLVGAVVFFAQVWLIALDPVIVAYREWMWRRYVRRVHHDAEEFLRRNTP
jgi:hypothetical protein